MLLSLSWLKEFTPYEGSAEALGDKLTMLGLELENILHPFEDIKDIVVGEVLECQMHPASDHLHCCKVDIGSGELLSIVCGAPNVAEGQKVAVAPIGARLPGGMVIKKAKLRGEPSFGMICSERELGLSDDHAGILILPDSVVVGQKLIDALALDQEVLDLSITPNRADCLSVLGIARETALAYGLPLHIPELPLLFDKKLVNPEVPVEITNPELCWLYSGRIVSQVRIAPAPIRMRYRLHAVGVRPISNVVDVTNYILLECGQPLHAFDLDKLAGGRIIVRPAKSGEKLVTLDGKERLLSPQDLCICDARRPVGLAGVMGGENTEIGQDSRNVFIESAVFQPQSVRKTARRLGLSTEASYRFERGVDQQRTIWALNRASALMASVSGGLVLDAFSLSEPRPFRPQQIHFCPERTDTLLGINLSADFQKDALKRVGCAVEHDEAKIWLVQQPSWRPDLTREVDLIEEIGRIYGLDAIEPSLPAVQYDPDRGIRQESDFDFWQRLRHWGAGLGLNEVINYSFVGHADLDLLSLSEGERISILNPLSAEQNCLRTILAPGLLQDLRNNLAQGVQSVRIFELAHSFHADSASETSAKENGVLALLLYGERYDDVWPKQPGELDYPDIKGIVENLLSFLHLGSSQYALSAKNSFLSPGIDLHLNTEYLGFIGRVKPEIAETFYARKPVWIAELGLNALRRLHDQALIRFQPLPVFPPVRRDITVIAPLAVTVGQIREKILGLRSPLLESVFLVDCYEPDKGCDRHLSFRLTFRHNSRTLKDAEVDKEREKVAEFLKREMNVRI